MAETEQPCAAAPATPKADATAPVSTSPSGLRVTAAEFVPTFGVQSNGTKEPDAADSVKEATTPERSASKKKSPKQHYSNGYDQQSYQQYNWGTGYQQYNDAATGYYDEYGNWVPMPTNDWSAYDVSAYWAAEDDSEQHQLGLRHSDAADWSELEVSQSQAVQLLRTWYPGQPAQLLRHLFTSCSGSLHATLQILSELEWEQSVLHPTTNGITSSKAAKDTTKPAKPAKPAKQQQQQQQRPKSDFSLKEDAFPELPMAKPAATSGTTNDDAAASPAPAPPAAAAPPTPVTTPTPAAPPPGSWAKIASKAAASDTEAAAAAAAAKAKQAATPTKPAKASSGDLDAAAVPWVSTGEAVSREYAAARAEARDHARVRNACFHEATKAFLAGWGQGLGCCLMCLPVRELC
jgi:hypothetical protein